MSSEPVRQPDPRRPGQASQAARHRSGAQHGAAFDDAESAALLGSADAAAEPDPQIRLTDPTTMRALAHPVRIALLELLAIVPTLTATQAAETLGETPANCAFHLRTLARYGFAREAGGGRGRERPWERVPMSLRVDRHQDDPQAALAAASLGQAWAARWLERFRRFVAAGATSPQWREASGTMQNIDFLTPKEAAELRREVGAVLSRYEKRHDPARLPADAKPVEMLFISYPLEDLAALGGQQPGPEGSQG